MPKPTLSRPVADEWLLTKKASLTESTWERDRQQVHKWVVPYLGNKPIASLEASDLLEVLKRIEGKGVIDTAHRTRVIRQEWSHQPHRHTAAPECYQRLAYGAGCRTSPLMSSEPAHTGSQLT